MTVSIDVNGTPYEVPSSAADVNWSAKQVAWEQAVSSLATTNRERIGDLETDVGDLNTLEWLEMGPLTNGWSALVGGESPRYAKQPNGVVWVVASIEGDGSASGMAAFTLPASFRPAVLANFICVAGASDDKAALITIDAGGVITVSPTLGSSGPNIEAGTDICISFPTTTVA